MKVKTSELSGAQLDLAVGQAQGLAVVESFGPLWRAEFAPSIQWAQGGPIIEQEGIALGQTGDGWEATCDGAVYISGQTPLIAAMRCYVMNALGKEVEIFEGESA